MGHERLGILPKSKRWRNIVADIALSSESDSSAIEINEYAELAKSAANKALANFYKQKTS